MRRVRYAKPTLLCHPTKRRTCSNCSYSWEGFYGAPPFIVQTHKEMGDGTQLSALPVDARVLRMLGRLEAIGGVRATED